jgi:WD40 repeat protein/formylglycine-generating enzyme required for sulfatase activity
LLLGLVPLGRPAGKEREGASPRQIENSIGMKLVLILAGKFTMGSPANEKGRHTDELRHDVEISKSFYLGVHEVTQGQFEKVMGFNPSYFSARATGRDGTAYEDWSKPGAGKDKVKDLGGTSDYPVENVSWAEAVEFCQKLSALPGEQKAGRRYRLPTEAEWEYACRGGASSYQVFHFGNSLCSEQANFRAAMPYGAAAKGPWLERTCKVGSYRPNAVGLFDMHGNVWEWCSDRYEYEGSRDFRVRRGGSWGDGGESCRSAIRLRRAPDDHRWNLGFRVAISLTAGEQARPPQVRATLQGHQEQVWSLAFSPDGRILASASGDQSVKMWDVATGKELAAFRHEAEGVRFARSVAFRRDGKILASSDEERNIKLVDVASRKESAILKLPGPDDAAAIAFTPDNKTLLISGEAITLLDVVARKERATLKGHTKEVRSLAISADGKNLVTCSLDKTVRLWDMPSGKLLAVLDKHRREVWSVAITADGKTIASGSADGTVILWDTATGRQVASLKGHKSVVPALAFSPDGKTLASGGWDRSVKLWDVASGKEGPTLKSTKQVWALAWSPDGKTLAVGHGEGAIKLWDLVKEE